MSIANINNAEHYTWGDGSDGWHLLKNDELSVIEECVRPNQQEQRHSHGRAQQFFYVLSGTAHIEIADVEYELAQGDGIHVPANTPHQLMNKSDHDLRFLVISQPKSHGDRQDL